MVWMQMEFRVQQLCFGASAESKSCELEKLIGPVMAATKKTFQMHNIPSIDIQYATCMQTNIERRNKSLSWYIILS